LSAAQGAYLAVKIVRQPNKIAINRSTFPAPPLFSPEAKKLPQPSAPPESSNALQSIGYEVTDLGDCAAPVSLPMTKNTSAPRKHPGDPSPPSTTSSPARKSASNPARLVLVLGGDCTQDHRPAHRPARRYYKHVNLFVGSIRDADLNTPASTPFRPPRRHGAWPAIIGKGSPELVRFLGESRRWCAKPDALIYGLQRVDQPEVDFLPARRCAMFTPPTSVCMAPKKSGARWPSRTCTQTTREFMVHVES